MGIEVERLLRCSGNPENFSGRGVNRAICGQSIYIATRLVIRGDLEKWLRPELVLRVNSVNLSLQIGGTYVGE